MGKYTTIALKFVKAFLLFVVFKMVLDWWRSGFGSLTDIGHHYPDILAEAFCFAIVWMLVTKSRRRKTFWNRSK